ncbi:flavin reductase family protein [Streptomyces sp. NPDC046881]|uniref:flavin reductase family protein n=1 Tax=Streptomyces sp. NPDC046881 TaxID=3155374 RepID=UPI0033FF65DD
MSGEQTPAVDLADFRLGMSRLASGVSVVATGSADDPAGWRGMTATAVSSLCADPPSLVACLNRGTGTYRELRHNSLFSVNLLSSRDVALARTFAGQDVFGAERFAPDAWSTGTLGVPVLAGALASFECRVSRSVDHGTHALLIGAIASIRWMDEASSGPLIYHRHEFRDLGAEVGVTGGSAT